jgi:hypothetical protein
MWAVNKKITMLSSDKTAHENAGGTESALPFRSAPMMHELFSIFPKTPSSKKLASTIPGEMEYFTCEWSCISGDCEQQTRQLNTHDHWQPFLAPCCCNDANDTYSGVLLVLVDARLDLLEAHGVSSAHVNELAVLLASAPHLRERQIRIRVPFRCMGNFSIVSFSQASIVLGSAPVSHSVLSRCIL